MKIGDKTMIQHVYENCATVLEHLVVATDDQRIFDAVEAFNGNVTMTDKAHLTGSDRCLEAVNLWEESQKEKLYASFPQERCAWMLNSYRAFHGIEHNPKPLGNRVATVLIGEYDYPRLFELLNRSADKYKEQAIWWK